jgi:SapC
MIDQRLFTAPQALDRDRDRQLRLKSLDVRFDRTAGINALFVAAAEFIDAARDYPIVFIEAGQGDDGQRDVAPVVVLGLAPGENLMLQPDGGWAARYVPALLRGYPLGLVRTDAKSYVIVIDSQADALSPTEGERLFGDDGGLTPLLEERRQHLERLEAEGERTRLFGRSLLELDLLRPMRFEATLPDGRKLGVDGFLTVDEQLFAALPPERVTALHKSGVLAMIYAHLFSLGLMRSMVERRVARDAPATA